LAVSNVDGTISIWNTNTWAWEAELIFGENIYEVEFSRDGTRLAVISQDQRLRVWDTHTWEAKTGLSNIGSWPRGLALFPDASRTAAASLQGIEIRDLRTASRLFGLGILTTSVAITKTGNQLMYGDLAGLVTIIDLETHEQVLLPDFAQPVWSVDWSPDARFILVGHTSGTEIRNLGVDPAAPVFVINTHGNSQLNDARFSSDGNLAVTLGEDSIIRI